MRRGLLLSSLVALAAAGAAGAAVPVTNVYVEKAAIIPAKSGTRSHPRPISSELEWDVSGSPAGQRPANVRTYKVFYAGIGENTRLFAGCATSTLARRNASVQSCPGSSLIGSGFLILMVGGSGYNDATYNGTCSSSLALFNGGHHNLTLFAYHGHPLPGQPTECTIPGDHAAINVRLARSRRGLTETFVLPRGLLHPAPGFDTPVIRAVLHVSARSRILNRRVAGRTYRRRVGLFESFLCPPSHWRRVVITYIREDGVTGTATALAACR